MGGTGGIGTTGRARARLAAFALALLLALPAGAGALAGCEGAPGVGPASTAAAPAAGGAGAGAGAREVIEPSPVAWGLSSFDYADVPEFEGAVSVTLGDGVPFFEDSDFRRGQFEEYRELDGLGRCGPAFALVGAETMPAEGTDRAGNGSVKPSGFRYDRYEWIPGKLLYNRCHLIAWSLAANPDDPKDLERDLITGTYAMNHAMAMTEGAVAAYVKDTGNHVLYRVTPVFLGDELVARGVLIEAASYEDRGDTLRYCVWCHNVQAGVEIDYLTGESRGDGSIEAVEADIEGYAYILNTASKVVHLPECRHVAGIKESNREGSNDPLDEIIARGYRACGNCKP